MEAAAAAAAVAEAVAVVLPVNPFTGDQQIENGLVVFGFREYVFGR